MMKPDFTPSTPSSVSPRRGAIALVLATLLSLASGSPAQAGFLETLRSIFTGDTEEGAQGNARGASIRDRRCGADVPIPTSDAPEEEVPSPDASVVTPEPLILLVPNTGQTIPTTAAIPDVFVYIPPSSGSERPEGVSSPEPKATSPAVKIDLEDIESVVDEDVLDQVEQIQQPELLLEFQFAGQTTYYALPEDALIARLQAPPEATFEVGDTHALEVRLVCRRVDLSDLSGTAAAEQNDATEAEVFVEVQRVAASDELLTALDTYEPEEVYQAYLNNQLWLEMVAALAAHPDSPEWAALLDELAIPAVDPMPQSLLPLTDGEAP